MKALLTRLFSTNKEQIDDGSNETLSLIKSELSGAGDISQFIPKIVNLCREYPENTEAKVCLAKCYQEIGEHHNAVNLLEKAIFIDKKNAVIQNLIGKSKYAQKLTEEADKHFEKAVKLDKKNAEYHYNRGLSLAELDWHIRAGRSFQHAIRLRKVYPEAYYELGLALSNEKQFRQAISAFKTAVKQKPELIPAWKNLALAYQHANRSDEALEALNKACLLNPEDNEIVKYHAWMLRQQSRRKEAISKLKDLLKSNPSSARSDAMIWFDLAETFLSAEQFMESYEACMGGLKIDPKSAHGLSLLGSIYLQVGNIEQAEETYLSANEIDPSDDYNLENLGLICDLKNKPEEAVHYYRQALDINPQNAHVFYNYMQNRKICSNDEEWIENCKTLLKNTTDNNDKVRLQFALGKTNMDLGNFDTSFNYYKRGNDKKFFRFDYDDAPLTNRIQEIVNYHSKQHRKLYDNSNFNYQPIFIISLSKNSRDILSHSLCQDSKIKSNGDLAFFPRFMEELVESNENNYSFLIDSLNDSLALTKSNNYIEESNKYLTLSSSSTLEDSSESIILNTNFYNFLCIGLISEILPNANFIYIIEDPLNVCLENYFTNYPNEYEHTFNLTSMGDFYSQYINLMDFWVNIYPDKFITIEQNEIVSLHNSQTPALENTLRITLKEISDISNESKTNLNWIDYEKNIHSLIRRIEENKR